MPPTREPDDPSLLSQVFATAGRPFHTVTNLLSGEFRQAGKQAARLPLDLGLALTAPVRIPASWAFPSLDATRLARSVGLADLNAPQVTDVMRAHGFAAPRRGSWEELGLNFVGGLPLDPLTWVGGVPGLARGGVSSVVRGVGPWAGRVIQQAGRPAAFVAGREAAMND